MAEGGAITGVSWPADIPRARRLPPRIIKKLASRPGIMFGQLQATPELSDRLPASRAHDCRGVTPGTQEILAAPRR